jgi:hypothetical protein
MGIKVKIILIKAYNSIKIIERYHNLVQHAYLIVLTEILSINRDMALQIAFKAINDTTRPDSLILTLLIYNALPQIVEYNALSPSIS